MSPEQGSSSATTAFLGGPARTGGAERESGAVPENDAVRGSDAMPGNDAARGETQALPTCTNCSATVSGKFCGQCGQRLEHAMHSVLHFSREVTEDLTHADSRLWSTMIALLFKPGFLTREFIAGRRVRYLPPLRLYLVLSVVFFLVLGSHEHKTVAMAATTGTGTPTVTIRPADQIDELATRPGETAQQREKRLCDPHYEGPLPRFVTPFLQKGCNMYVEDRTRTAGERFMHTLPRAMFILLPVLALLMKLMYWRPRRYYVEHLLFFLHNHAFGFLVFAMLMLVTRFAPASVGNWATFIVWLYLPYYLFVSMRQVYGQGRGRTFTKLAVLAVTYLIGGVMTLALTGVYSVFSS